MDYSAANTALWNVVIQVGIISISIVFANFLRRKLSLIRSSLIPTAVLAGFLLLLLRTTGVLRMDAHMLEMITYHGIALGFIALSLRMTDRDEASNGSLTGAKSGALIVSTYLVQAIVGLIITLFLSYTVMPELFRAAGILLPMGYGQGPGQANNVGSSYEALGFVGGRSFGLSLAATGYLVACLVGVTVLNVLIRRGKVLHTDSEIISGSVTIDVFQDKDEIPISESLDRLSMQVSLIIGVYLLTYLATWGVTSGIAAISASLANTLNSLLWGFNFIIGSALAILTRTVMKKLRGAGIMHRQYQNNYLLSRISGFAFDIMITAGIASIEISDLQNLWLPFLLLSVAGAFATWFFLAAVCKKIYPNYYYEGLISMFGMLTGTISSGVLLLREIDAEYKTPAADNLILGSSFGIIFGIPVLLLVGLAPKSDLLCFVVLALCAVYLAGLLAFIYKVNRRKK